jgi:hypothetical protein
VAQTADRFAPDAITGNSARDSRMTYSRQQTLATMALMGINRIVATDGVVK